MELIAPFPLNDHDIRYGHKIRGGQVVYYVSVNNTAMRQRVADFDPAYTTTLLRHEVIHYFPHGADQVVAAVDLTLNGVARIGVGVMGAVISRAKAEGDPDIVHPLTNTELKGAVTLAFSNACEAFGVGEYLKLHHLNKIIVNAGQNSDTDAQNAFEARYNAVFGTTYRAGDIWPHLSLEIRDSFLADLVTADFDFNTEVWAPLETATGYAKPDARALIDAPDDQAPLREMLLALVEAINAAQG